MSPQMSQVESFRRDACDFSVLRHRPIFTVGLSSSYLANGRFISSQELEVWILDDSEMAEAVRTNPKTQFRIDLLDGTCLQGSVSVTLFTSQIGEYQKRYVEARLRLIEANVGEAIVPAHKWLT